MFSSFVLHVCDPAKRVTKLSDAKFNVTSGHKYLVSTAQQEQVFLMTTDGLKRIMKRTQMCALKRHTSRRDDEAQEEEKNTREE